MKKNGGEIISNSVISGLSFPISIVMMILLIINSNNVLDIIFSIFISIGFMLLSVFQILYYILNLTIFKKLSYIFFITTITLFFVSLCLDNLGIISWIMFGLSIGFLIINIIFSSISINWFKIITFGCNILLFLNFIIISFLFNLKTLIFIFLIISLLLILFFYYLYDNKIYIHYLLSISILLLIIIVYIFLLI